MDEVATSARNSRWVVWLAVASSLLAVAAITALVTVLLLRDDSGGSATGAGVQEGSAVEAKEDGDATEDASSVTMLSSDEELVLVALAALDEVDRIINEFEDSIAQSRGDVAVWRAEVDSQADCGTRAEALERQGVAATRVKDAGMIAEARAVAIVDGLMSAEPPLPVEFTSVRNEVSRRIRDHNWGVDDWRGDLQFHWQCGWG